ncbi:opacity protein-like surface antigen [Elusimicrobium simillimum]|uniref:outer membrane beta-barrel protein n=1 Tax=Elusimicrobium simillimum TaxID=3143438 RepID=UPI003C704D95
MKKILLLAVLFVSVSAFAGIDYGLEAGQTRLGVYGGISVPQDWDLANGASEAPGETGPLFGIELIRNINTIFALGIDLNYASYGNNDIGNGGKIKSHRFGGNVVGRINFFPEQPTRIYIPAGVGLNYYKAEDNAGNSENQTGVAFFGGVGVEFDLSPVWTLGMEGRYTFMPLDSDKFADDFSSLDLVLKLGARF